MQNVVLTAAYLLFGAAGIGINCLANRRDWSRHTDTVSASFMLFVFAVLSTISVGVIGKPDGFKIFPFMDIMGGLYVLSICIQRFTWWKLALTLEFLLQLVFHACFWWGFPAHVSNNYYLASINVVYLLQVMTAATPGGMYVAADILTRLRDHPGHGHRVGHEPYR